MEQRWGIADVVWLSIVQWLGGEQAPKGALGWDRLAQMARLAVGFDPKYFTIYHAVGWYISSMARRGDLSDELAELGRAELPDRWEFPFIRGYNAYFIDKDFPKASEWMELAARKPKPPMYLAALAARMRAQSGDPHSGIALLEMLIPTLEDPLTKNSAEERLKLLRTELRFQKFDVACQRYLTETGTIPPSVYLLVQRGWVDEPPVDYFDTPLHFDARCRARSQYLQVRDDEAAEIAAGRREPLPASP
jgi:hypothetical protein